VTFGLSSSHQHIGILETLPQTSTLVHFPIWQPGDVSLYCLMTKECNWTQLNNEKLIMAFNK